jgi:hypothetical protein
MKFVSEATSEEVIADVVVPINISVAAADSVTFATQNPTATLRLDFATALADGAAMTAAATSALNAAVEAGVNDPYNIPNVSEVLVSQGYLEAPVVSVIDDIV